MRYTLVLLLALAVGQAAAWNCPGGVKGADTVTGYSVFFGIKGESKPLTYVDQTSAWKKFGPITKINLYYSYTHGCLQGFKATYGYDSKHAQLLGTEKNLAEQSITLAPYEHINKIQLKEASSKCVEWIKIFTNKTSNSVAIGNAKSTAPIKESAANKPGGFLAAVRGYEDLYAGKTPSKGGLQQLQFVWGIAVCPSPPKVGVPVVKPPPEVNTPTGALGEPEPTPAPTPEPEPLCPPAKDKCDVTAKDGSAFCPAITPFTSGQCIGGCCVSAGKCKKPLCHLNGLGSEVMAKDVFCWGTNNGFLHNKFNKCKNLGCKLAVPGCVGDPISGACVGTVSALSEDVDSDAKAWLGLPCLQPVPGGLPLNALGHWDSNGAYAGKLWTICNCKAGKTLPCVGPLCELLEKPDLPSFNFALPKFDLPDVGKLINAKVELLGNITELFKPNLTIPHIPAVTIPTIDLKAHLDEVKSFINGTATALSGPVLEALHAKFPTFTLNLTKPEVPSLSLNIPHPNLNLGDLLPSLNLAQLPDKTKLRVFNTSSLSLSDLHRLEGILAAFNAAQKD